MESAKPESSTFKSFMRPLSFWSKSKITDHSQPDHCTFTEKPVFTTYSTSSNRSLLSTFSIGKKSVAPTSCSVALKETAKGEVYKLSTVEHGAYRPPSPGVEGKRDHWLDIREDIMDFHLPNSTACLTTQYNEKHDLYTPYTFLNTQPYVFPL